MVVRQGGQSRGLQHKAAVLMQTVLRSGVRTSSVVRGACCLAGWLMVTSHALAAETITFNRDIRPILSDNCFFCHGPDAGTREAELRLDTAEGLFGEAGVQGTVLPGDPAASELIRRIRSSDADELMPPPESHKELTPEQIALLERWVAEGADYEGHWAFEPVVVADTAHSSTTEAIDDLVSRRLAERELPAVGQADRVTLLRRLHFDLTGLPPTPAEAEAFLADGSPDAYEQLVDRLLSSPHYGERMAMWWLDLVRYADTVGYHGDQPMSVSPFRDYVIAAFNSNMPFDQFTIEQLAGDLLEEPTTQQQIAAGYNRLGMMSAEGGVQPKEYLAKYIAERVRNVSGAWLGVTLGCAECHDHKFDPFTSRDFYRFEAFFADIKERGLYAGGQWGPNIQVPDDAEQAKRAALEKSVAEAKQQLLEETPAVVAARKAWEETLVAWTPLVAEKVESRSGVTLTPRDDGALLASGENPATDTYTLRYDGLPAGVTAVRLDVLPDGSLPKQGPGRAGNGNFVLSEIRLEVHAEDGSVTPVPLQNASATYEQTGAAGENPYGKWAVTAAIDEDAKGPTWGWAVMEQVGRPHAAVFETGADLTLPEGSTLVVHLDQNLDNPQHTIGCFRLSATTAARPVAAADAVPAAVAAAVAMAEADRSSEQQALVAEHFRSIAAELAPLREQIASLEKQRADLDAAITTTLVTETVEPRMVRVLARGNWMDESGEEVTPGVPEALCHQPADGESEQVNAEAEDRLTRLDLARWIVNKKNPLTARVFANRLWAVLFGEGLSRRLDDVGAQGEWPTHPELLDRLAADFMTHDWDVKWLVKAIVMSDAYQRSSVVTPELVAVDPGNRWLAHQGRFRLDAELVRDNTLAISGLLVRRVGGESVFPYQPVGYWAYLNFPSRQWQQDSGDDLYRRGLYTHWQRQYLHPSLLAFDAPSREECTAKRARSNTPLQSLALLNDPSYVEAARVFAQELLTSEGTERERLDRAFQRAVTRSATDEELAVLVDLLASHRAAYLADAEAAAALVDVGEAAVPESLETAELAAWTNVARVILNLHEVVTRN